MMRSYSIAEARSSLPRIVDLTDGGLDIELTRRGKPVAVVVSLRQFERLRSERPRFGEAYRRFLEKHPLNEAGVEDEFLASGRYRGAGRAVPL